MEIKTQLPNKTYLKFIFKQQNIIGKNAKTQQMYIRIF